MQSYILQERIHTHYRHLQKNDHSVPQPEHQREGGADEGELRRWLMIGGQTATAPPSTSGSSGDSESTRRRSSDGEQTAGRAVPRPSGGGTGGGRTTVIVPGYWGGWAPWGWGGIGFGGYFGGYYGGYWDPWYAGGGDPYYDSSWGTGALRLKVKPRDASVFVDGYYAGTVDQFDGVFQRLKLESGPHRIEVSADGYETLMFDINVTSDRTTTYEGELTRLP